MKFNTSSGLLADTLSVLNKAISTNLIVPAMECFCFTIKGSDCSISSNNGTAMMTKSIVIESEIEATFMINAKKLLPLLKSLPNQALVVELVNGLATFKTGSGNYEMPYEPGEDFPRIRHESKIAVKIPADQLSIGLYKTIFNVAPADTGYPERLGVFIEGKGGKLSFASTDGNNIAAYTIQCDADGVYAIAPASALKIIPESKDVVSLSVSGNSIELTLADGLEISIILITGKFPNWAAVVPKDTPNVLTVSKHELLSAIKRVSIFANKQTSAVKLEITEGVLSVSSECKDFNEAGKDTVSCDYVGEDIAIGIKGDIFCEILSHCQSENVIIGLITPSSVITIREEGLDESLFLSAPIMLE